MHDLDPSIVQMKELIVTSSRAVEARKVHDWLLFGKPLEDNRTYGEDYSDDGCEARFDGTGGATKDGSGVDRDSFWREGLLKLLDSRVSPMWI